MDSRPTGVQWDVKRLRFPLHPDPNHFLPDQYHLHAFLFVKVFHHTLHLSAGVVTRWWECLFP